jgi:hypothetical protein
LALNFSYDVVEYKHLYNSGSHKMLDTWICLTPKECNFLSSALAAYADSGAGNVETARVLARKLLPVASYPDITIGVYGGQVQWSLGNPFPIRICDYDGERDDLPHFDERGQRCRIWFEPLGDALSSVSAQPI